MNILNAIVVIIGVPIVIFQFYTHDVNFGTYLAIGVMVWCLIDIVREVK